MKNTLKVVVWLVAIVALNVLIAPYIADGEICYRTRVITGLCVTVLDLAMCRIASPWIDLLVGDTNE